MTTDARIEAFHQSVEHLTSIPGILDTLGITIARADELLHLIAKCSCPIDSAQLREEQSILGHLLTLRIRQVHLEGELRQGFQGIGDQLRTAIDATKNHVTTAVGGAEAAQKFPFVRRHLEMLSRYRDPLPTSETIRLRLGLLKAAWQAIDAAMASLDEIRFDARVRGQSASGFEVVRGLPSL